MGNFEDVTVGDLMEHAKNISKPGLKIREWKIITKEFGKKHGLTGKEAVRLDRVANWLRLEMSKWTQ